MSDSHEAYSQTLYRKLRDHMNKYPNGAIAGSKGINGFKERLKCVREMRHMTQQELADKLELPVSEMSHYETGQRLPGAVNLRRLCLALNVSADYLLDLH